MKKFYLVLVLLSVFSAAYSQKEKKTQQITDAALSQASETACKCIDSIAIIGRKRKAIDNDISNCIDKQAVSYQLMSKIMTVATDKVDDDKKGKGKKSKDGKNINIELATEKESNEYKKYYYEMERHLMENCAAMKIAMGSNEVKNEKSVSENKEAIQFYDKGLAEVRKENWKGAIDLFKKAIAIDPDFAFAYDNIGICYRQLGDFDKAIEYYEKSLEIDPNGKTPLQNIAVAYQYKKEYQKAIDTYMKLAELDANDPEIFYGIGQIYALYLDENEKGLNYMCKAYNLYVAYKSPYRTDAEKIINMIYAKMKQQGKEAKFNEILKNNKISPN